MLPYASRQYQQHRLRHISFQSRPCPSDQHHTTETNGLSTPRLFPEQHVDITRALIRPSRTPTTTPSRNVHYRIRLLAIHGSTASTLQPYSLAPLGGSLGTESAPGDLLARAKRSLGGWSLLGFPANQHAGASHVCASLYLSRCMELVYSSAKAPPSLHLLKLDQLPAQDIGSDRVRVLVRATRCFARLDCAI